MRYRLDCDIDSNGNPTIRLIAEDSKKIQIIIHVIIKEHDKKHKERILLHNSGEDKKTNQGFDVPFLQWEFSIRKYILSFMDSTPSSFNHAKAILKKEARKTKPNISTKKHYELPNKFYKIPA